MAIFVNSKKNNILKEEGKGGKLPCTHHLLCFGCFQFIFIHLCGNFKGRYSLH